jgi:hypothetical protein
MSVFQLLKEYMLCGIISVYLYKGILVDWLVNLFVVT